MTNLQHILVGSAGILVLVLRLNVQGSFYAEFLDSVTDSGADLGHTIKTLCLGCIICYMNISLVSVMEIL